MASVHEHQQAFARLSEGHALSPLSPLPQAIEKGWVAGTTPEERRQEEMSIGAERIGAAVDECYLLRSSRIVATTPLGRTQSVLMCDSVGNRAAGLTASPPMSRRSPSSSSLTGCRMRPPQMQEWLDTEPSPGRDRAQDPVPQRQQPEVF